MLTVPNGLPFVVLADKVSSQGWKKANFFPLENRVFGFNE